VHTHTHTHTHRSVVVPVAGHGSSFLARRVSSLDPSRWMCTLEDLSGMPMRLCLFWLDIRSLLTLVHSSESSTPLVFSPKTSLTSVTTSITTSDYTSSVATSTSSTGVNVCVCVCVYTHDTYIQATPPVWLLQPLLQLCECMCVGGGGRGVWIHTHAHSSCVAPPPRSMQ
jgi:hypothetical protein